MLRPTGLVPSLLPGLLQRSALLSVITLASLSCATPPEFAERSERRGEPKATTPSHLEMTTAGLQKQEAQDLQDLQTLYSKNAFEAALIKMGQFESRYPRSTQVQNVMNLHGLTLLLLKRPREATQHFKRALDVAPSKNNADNHWKQYVRYNLAAAQFDAEQLTEAQETLQTISPELLDSENRAKLYLLRARIQERQGQPVESVREILLASRDFEKSGRSDVLERQVESSLGAIEDSSELRRLYQGHEESPLAEILLFRLLEKELEKGSVLEAEESFKLLKEKFPDSPRVALARDRMDALRREKSQTKPQTVGVLLPLTGKFARFGQRSLQGIQLAFRIFNSTEPDSKVTLVLEDTGDEPEQALQALNRLFYKHGVVAVIGPLLSKGAEQISARAGELGLPLISLSQQPGPPSNFVFQAGMTPKLQAREIARHAIEDLKLKRFAILYPNDRFGKEYGEEFWNAVESMGGRITALESYPQGETDFRQQIDRLSGLYYTEARFRELDALAKEREANNIKKKTRKTEQFFNLPPVVDYDAVFIPDEPKVAGLILPTFAYRDVDRMRFLGISAWNSPELSLRAQKSAESAYFVDAFSAQSTQPAVKKFVDKFRATFGQEPGAMEAFAYDAASIVEKSLAPTRSELAERLRHVGEFPGTTGRITYDQGVFTRNLKILTVRDGQITEVR